MPTSLDSLLTCLRFPSISTDSCHARDLRDCAEWLALQLRTAGFATQVHPTPGHPIIVAKNTHRPGRPNVLLYGHYDVQPVDPLELWHSPPFEPRVEDGIIYARGATDNKGQLMAHLCGLRETMIREGDLPVNLTVLLEGEEEIGSPNLAPFLEQNRGALACDLVAISDTGMVGPGIPTFTYGLRGIACCEITLTGPSTDLHSGIFGGAVANPATELARLIAQLHDTAGRVQIDGFYDAVRPLAEWERHGWATLPLNDTAFLTLTGSPALYGEEGYSSVERTWGRPTAEVNGLWGGYQGEGSKTVIPSKASAKFSFRLVPGQDPELLMPQIEAWFHAHTPAVVQIDVHVGHSGRPYLMDPHSRFGKAAQSALRSTFQAEPALIREGGSIPIVHAFKEILSADTLLLGLALPDCRAPRPPMKISPIANFEAGIRLNQELLRALAAVV